MVRIYGKVIARGEFKLKHAGHRWALGNFLFGGSQLGLSFLPLDQESQTSAFYTLPDSRND